MVLNGKFFLGVLASCVLVSSVAFSAPVTSPFGWRIHPVYGGMRFHTGADIGYEGGTEIPAMLPGIVEFADWWSGYGRCVILKHDNDERTLYAHMDVIDVKPGQEVQIGTVLGTVGQTGVATGPHLHLEYWKNGQYVDPLVLFGLPPNGGEVYPVKIDGQPVMPAYTLAGQGVSVSSVPDVRKKSYRDGLGDINPMEDRIWKDDAETVAFVADERDSIRQSPTPYVSKKEEKKKESVVAEEETKTVRDYMREAYFRRRRGISRPYYSKKEQFARDVLDALTDRIFGKPKKPVEIYGKQGGGVDDIPVKNAREGNGFDNGKAPKDDRKENNGFSL